MRRAADGVHPLSEALRSENVIVAALRLRGSQQTLELCEDGLSALEELRIEKLVVRRSQERRQLRLEGPLTIECDAESANVVGTPARKSGPDDQLLPRVSGTDRIGLLAESIPCVRLPQRLAQGGTGLVERISDGAEFLAKVEEAGCHRTDE
jgi:hypothetical protein